MNVDFGDLIFYHMVRRGAPNTLRKLSPDHLKTLSKVATWIGDNLFFESIRQVIDEREAAIDKLKEPIANGTE